MSAARLLFVLCAAVAGPATAANGASHSAHSADAHQGHPGGHGHGAQGHGPAHQLPGQGSAGTREPVEVPGLLPPITDADRTAAFPALQGHTVHDDYLAWHLLIDQLEYQDADDGSTFAWDIEGWLGGDIDRAWLRAEGERLVGETEHAELQLLWGHATGPWWEAVMGLRQDFKPGSPQTWAALGLQGMPLYGLETEATAFVGEAGQTALRLEADYDLLLTNRLILQPLVEATVAAKDEPERGIGSGLNKVEAGLRLRYEFNRRFAPYIGISHERMFGDTADYHRAAGEHLRDTRWVAGVRVWF